jgi:DUF4097 and DUF4098 domain-containing protein YvlB
VRTAIIVGVFALSAGLLLADVEEQNTEQRTFQMASGPRKLIVDNVNGKVEVTGYSGNTVDVTVRERWRADSAERMAEAKRDIKLDMTTEGNTVKLYVDGPFRCRDGCVHMHGRTGYDFNFDFTVRVPLDAALEVRTVNGGPLRVDNSTGPFTVSNVNGGIDMKGISGTGSVTSVNGGINVTFTNVPPEACTFKSVNGSIDVQVPAAFGGNVQFKTLNGALYTDFDAAYLSSIAEPGTREGTRFVYRRGGTTRLRLGSGGPEHKFETVNGNITIRKSDR